MTTPAAWHPDPLGRHQYRYWDGTVWTEHVSNDGEVTSDPLADTPAAQGGQQPVDEVATSAAAAQPGSQAGAPPGSQAGAAPGPQAGTSWGPQAGTTAAPASGGGTDGLSLAALIIGLLSLLVAWIPFLGLLGVVGGVIAVVLGLLGRGRARRAASGAGLAISGLVCGVLAVLLGIASTLLPVLFFQGMIGDFEEVDRCIEQTGDEDACVEEHAPGWVRFLDAVDD